MAVAAVVLAMLVAGCGGWKPKTLPNVEYVNFVAALQCLHDAGFKVAVPYFPPFASTELAEQGRGQLSNYVVVRERRLSGDAVALTLSLPRFRGPFGSMDGRIPHPATVVVPDLVGETYADAWKQLSDPGESGMWIRASTVDPLAPEQGRRGLDAFRVASQIPRPGTRVGYEGELPGRPGVDPRRATITVTLTTGGQISAGRASLQAAVALRAAAKTGAGLGPFPRSATADSCRIAEGGFRKRYVYGECFTGGDLSGKNPVVVYRQLWDGRDFRADGAAARPNLEHVWEVTVSPAGRVLSVRSFGAFPPQLVR